MRLACKSAVFQQAAFCRFPVSSVRKRCAGAWADDEVPTASRCRQCPDGRVAPPEPDPGDDDASEPAAPPSAAPPLREPPLGPVGGDWTGVCRIGCAPEDAQDGQEEVGEAGELDGADDEYNGAVTAGPPDADVGALAGALVALTGGLAAGARAEALDGAAAVVVSTDPRDTRRLGLYGAAGTSSELAEPTFAWLRAAVRLDAASLPERVPEELTAPMMSVRASSKTTSATRRRRRIVARLGRDGSLLIVATGEHNPTGPGRSRRQRPPSTMHPLSEKPEQRPIPTRFTTLTRHNKHHRRRRHRDVLRP